MSIYRCHVDICTNVHVVNEIKKLLSSHFEMKDIGEADVILGIKIRKTNDDFSLC